MVCVLCDYSSKYMYMYRGVLGAKVNCQKWGLRVPKLFYQCNYTVYLFSI